jgi:hypothetical protein
LTASSRLLLTGLWLKRPISITVTSSPLEKLYTISEPFSELEELSLLSRDNIQLALPKTFRWGPDHPAPTDDLAIFTDSPHRLTRMFKADLEAVGDLRVWIWVRCLAKLLEVLNSDAIFIWGVTEDDNIKGLRSLMRRMLGRS